MSPGDKRYRQMQMEMDALRRELSRLRKQTPLDVLTSSVQTNCWLVLLSYKSGNDGNATNAPAFVYDVFAPATGSPIGTNLQPITGRTFGSFGHAQYGFGYYDNSNAFVLVYAIETPQTARCAT